MHTLKLDYFFALEDDLERYSRYVEVHEKNYKTFSLELVRLLLAAGSEIDVTLKDLCSRIDPTKKPKNIDDYKSIILTPSPLGLPHDKIDTFLVTIPRYKTLLHPWKDWKNANPTWWRAYNDVKHNRIKNYEDASLENVLNAVAGLGVIMQFLCTSDNDPYNFRGHFFSNLNRFIQF